MSAKTFTQIINAKQFTKNVAHEKITPKTKASEKIKIRVANNINDRMDAYHFLYKTYLEKEYAYPNDNNMWYSIFDALPDTITLIAVIENKIIGAITIVFPGEFGLPAEKLYQEEIYAMRAKGHIPGEIISFGIDPNFRGSSNLLSQLLNSAFATHRITPCSEFLCTVNPRHAAFYKRKLNFSEVGKRKQYEKVGGAAAVLLSLDITEYKDSIKTEKHLRNSRTLYPNFLSEKAEEIFMDKIKEDIIPMSKHEFEFFFKNNPSHNILQERIRCRYFNKLDFSF